MRTLTHDSPHDSSNENQPLLNHHREERIRYPRSIPFIVCNEFCERFNYYGLRAILLIYLTKKLNYDDDIATVIFHLSTMMVYLCAPFGAIIADSWWGKFKTIFSFSIIYAIGSSVVAIGSVEPWNVPANELTLIGLALIAIGSGGIKPCVSAFGGEQFSLPEQATQLVKFFSIFYFSINLGSVLTTFVTPLLRSSSCLGMDQCFPAGFGLPAVLMLISILIFASGYSMYKIVPPQGNMVVKVVKCICNAIKMKMIEQRVVPRDHWLDYAEMKHGRKLVKESKAVLNIIIVFLPLPIFWTLFDQQGSRWTSQAMKMNGDLGFYKLQPDQMQMTNPFLILVFIPLFELVLYPLLSLIGIRRPLQKMSLGGVLAGVAFLCSMFVQFEMDKSAENTVSMLWQLPQYIIMTTAEVMFSVTGLEFAFTQAPESMKSVIQSFWMLTVACGDFVVTLVVGTRLLEDQSMEFLLFACLMFIDILVFMILAYRYKTIKVEEIIY